MLGAGQLESSFVKKDLSLGNKLKMSNAAHLYGKDGQQFPGNFSSTRKNFASRSSKLYLLSSQSW